MSTGERRGREHRVVSTGVVSTGVVSTGVVSTGVVAKRQSSSSTW